MSIFHNSSEFLLATAAVMFVLSAITVLAARKQSIDWRLAAFLIGSYIGVPIIVSRIIAGFGFTSNESGTASGWLLQCTLAWIVTWLPFGTAGLVILACLRKWWQRPLTAEIKSQTASESSRAIRFMQVVSGTLWLLMFLSPLLSRRH